MSGKQEHYPVELKLEAVRMFYEESKMYQEITTALGICDAAVYSEMDENFLRGRNRSIQQPPRKPV